MPHLTLDATLQALPSGGNRTRFTGTLCQVDVPSVAAPQGADGRPVVLPRAVALRALDSLCGMPVNVQHIKERIVGTVQRGWIDGNALKISGIFFSKNLPSVVAGIQRDQRTLGLSFELENVEIADLHAATWVISDCTFCGCAVLAKSAAAYGHSTSIAAKKEETDPLKHVVEQLNEIQRSLVTATVLHARQAPAPTPERSTRTYHEMDKRVQEEQPWATIGHRMALELSSRGIARSAPSPAPLLASTPDHAMHPINWDETVNIGNGCTVRRGGMAHVQFSDAISVAERHRQADMQAGRIGNGQVYLSPPQHPLVTPIDPRDADLHQAKTLEELDAEWKARGLSVAARMANAIRVQEGRYDALV